jgi:hypothetical protein
VIANIEYMPICIVVIIIGGIDPIRLRFDSISIGCRFGNDSTPFSNQVRFDSNSIRFDSIRTSCDVLLYQTIIM